jgi:hypothetical protein
MKFVNTVYRNNRCLLLELYRTQNALCDKVQSSLLLQQAVQYQHWTLNGEKRNVVYSTEFVKENYSVESICLRMCNI